jgi:hypothetical protein
VQPTPVPDPVALRRRVLLAGVATFAAYLTTAYVLAATDAPSWLLFPALLLIVVLVVRPLMRPVLQADRLRRALAYQAFLDGRDRRRG